MDCKQERWRKVSARLSCPLQLGVFLCCLWTWHSPSGTEQDFFPKPPNPDLFKGEAGTGGVTTDRSRQVAMKMSAGLHSHLQAWLWRNLLTSSFRLLVEFISLWLCNWGTHLCIDCWLEAVQRLPTVPCHVALSLGTLQHGHSQLLASSRKVGESLFLWLATMDSYN